MLVVDDHAVAVAQKRAKARVQIVGGGKAVFGIEEGCHHVALHGPGAKQRDIGDEVVVLIGLHLADQLALPGTLDLKHTERVAGANVGKRGFVVVRNGVELDKPVGLDVGGVTGQFAHLGRVRTVHALNLAQGVRQGRLHAHAQHVEFEEAHVIDVVFVELAHGQPHAGGLHGAEVVQLVVAEDHATRVHGDVAGESVEAFGHVDEQLEAGILLEHGDELTHLGLGVECAPKVPGVEAPDVLGDKANLLGGEAQGHAGIARGTTCAIGVLHRHQAHAGTAVALKDGAVDLVAPGRLHVDVDVGQCLALVAQEALKQQVVLEGVDVADAQ